MTESALPLSRLGGDSGDRGSRPRAPPIFEVRGFFRLLFREGAGLFDMEEILRSVMSPPGVELVDKGLAGFDRPMCFGGCGKAPMLTVFLSDFPAGKGPAGPPSAERTGTEGEVVCRGPGRAGSAEEETALIAVAGLGRSELRVVGPTFELRDLGMGSEGKGPVGGAIEGRAGRGSELPDMLKGLPLRGCGVECKSLERGRCAVDPSAFHFSGLYGATLMSVT